MTFCIFTQLFRWLWPPAPGALSDLQPSLTYQTPQGHRSRDCSHRWHVDLDLEVGAPRPHWPHPRPEPWGVVGEAGLGAERMMSLWGRCWGWRLTAEKQYMETSLLSRSKYKTRLIKSIYFCARVAGVGFQQHTQFISNCKFWLVVAEILVKP